MEFLCIFLFVLGVMVLLGHGIWVICAALIRWIIGTPRVSAPVPVEDHEEIYCVACRVRMEPWERTCPSCGFERFSLLARELVEIDAARRQVRGLRDRVEIDADIAGSILLQLKHRRGVLLGNAPEAAEPATAPTVVAGTGAEVISHPTETVALAPQPHPPSVLPTLAADLPVLDVLPVEETKPVQETQPATRPRPRRSFGELLSGFMEERNILWGELVGGLLIVCCSIALVLSLWKNLQTLPYFPFLIFTALTGALFAAGHYTLHHWKLDATSRGLLLIALLLAPLNLLVLADPSARGPVVVPPIVDGLVDLIAVGLLGGIVLWAARGLLQRELLPGVIDPRVLLTLGIVGPPAVQLLSQYLFATPLQGPPSATWMGLLGGAIGVSSLSNGLILRGLLRPGDNVQPLRREQNVGAWIFLGLTTFAVLASFGFLVTRFAFPGEAVHAVAAPIVVAGVPVLALGLGIKRRLGADEPSSTQAIATGVALAGFSLMLGGVGTSWPAPLPLLVSSLIFGSMVGWIAYRTRMARWYVGALPALSLTALLGVYLAMGRVPLGMEAISSQALLKLLFSAESGVILAVIATLFGAGATAFRSEEYRADGVALARAAFSVGSLALGIVTWHGPEEPRLAALGYAICVLSSGAATFVWPRRWLAQIATFLVIPGTLWALQGFAPERFAWWGGVLAAQTLVLQGLGWGRWRHVLGRASHHVALLAGFLSLSFTSLGGLHPPEWIACGSILVLAVALLIRWLCTAQVVWFAGFQVGVTLAVVSGITRYANPIETLNLWRTLQLCGLGLALLGLGWEIARRMWKSAPWDALSPALDRTLHALVVVAVLVQAAVATTVATLSEWGDIPVGSFQPLLDAVPGALGWVLVGALALPVVLSQWRRAGDRQSPAAPEVVLQLLLLGITVPLLYAVGHHAELAGASAARWSLAISFVVGSMLLWGRDSANCWTTRWGFARFESVKLGYGMGVIVAGVVVWLTSELTARGLSGRTLAGPLADSIFGRMGTTANSIGPILLVVLGLVGTALRERLPSYALGAGVLLPLSVMGGAALGMVQRGQPIGPAELSLIGLLGCDTAAVSGLIWLAGRRWIGEGRLLTLQCWLGMIGLAVIAAPVTLCLGLGPTQVSSRALSELGGIQGWLALILVTLATGVEGYLRRRARRIHAVGCFTILAGLLVVAGTASRDTLLVWFSFRAVAGVWGGAAVLLTAVGSVLSLTGWRTRVFHPLRVFQRWLVVLTVALFLLALCGLVHETILTPVPAALFLTASVLMGAMALWFQRGIPVHLSGVLFNLAVVCAWLAWTGRDTFATSQIVILALAMSAAFWWGVDLPWAREGWSRFREGGGAYAPIATLVALLFLAGTVGFLLLGEFLGSPIPGKTRYSWAALLCVGATLWLAVEARYYRLGLPGFYLLGIIAAGLIEQAWGGSFEQLVWHGLLLLAAHGFLVGLVVHLWQLWHPLHPTTRLMLPYPVLPDREWKWIVPAQTLLGVAVVLAALRLAMWSTAIEVRLIGSVAIALLIPSTWWLGRAVPEHRERELRVASLALVLLSAIALAWAIPNPQGAIVWLQRHSGTLIAFAFLGILGVEVLGRWSSGARFALGTCGVAIGWAGVVLAYMLPAFDPLTRRTPLEGWYVIGIVLALVALIIEAFRLAVRGDPLGTRDSRRGAYVYLAELVLIFLFVHLRLNVPELFIGPLARYWTFLVLGGAFAWVMLAEWAQRRGHQVLATPLMRTGVLLPVIPILAFWARPPQALLVFADAQAPGLRPLLNYLDRMPWNYETHALVWLLTSVLYALVAWTRRSTRWGILAALAGNFGFWALLLYAGVGFFLHPQVWIIPLALILLVSEYLHRDELAPATAESARYLGITLIYVASTADLFLTGLGNSVWLPLALAALCVLGVLAGIFFRVRAFLFLGIGFLVVDLLAMIWHAAIDRSHTWLLWASGIALGVAILALFAVFEKRRHDVLHLMEQLRRWN